MRVQFTEHMVEEWKRETWDAVRRETNWRNRPSWDVAGLSSMLSVAEYTMEQESGLRLPYNTLWDIFYGYGPKKQYRDLHMVEDCARLVGWMKHLHKYPLLRRLLEKTTDGGRGVNSPYNAVSLVGLSKQGSPGHVQRRLYAVRRRANRILAPFQLKCSWKGLGIAVQAHKRNNKAAIIAAAQTVSAVLCGHKVYDYEPVCYKQARSLLIRWKNLAKVRRGAPTIALHKEDWRDWREYKPEVWVNEATATRKNGFIVYSVFTRGWAQFMMCKRGHCFLSECCTPNADIRWLYTDAVYGEYKPLKRALIPIMDEPVHIQAANLHGFCSAGVKRFLAANNLPDCPTVGQLLNIVGRHAGIPDFLLWYKEYLYSARLPADCKDVTNQYGVLFDQETRVYKCPEGKLYTKRRHIVREYSTE